LGQPEILSELFLTHTVQVSFWISHRDVLPPLSSDNPIVTFNLKLTLEELQALPLINFECDSEVFWTTATNLNAAFFFFVFCSGAGWGTQAAGI